MAWRNRNPTDLSDAPLAPLPNLLERTKEGDEDAFAELYQASSAKLFGVVLRILRDPEQASEVLQEVYLRIWQNARAYQPDKGAPMVWMIAIARNRALDRRRARRPLIPLDDLGEVADPAAAIGFASDGYVGAQARALRHCLDELDHRQRDYILLAFAEGYTHAELAQRFDSPLGTVKSLIRRGLLRLKDCLER